MFLKKLELANFRNYKNITIEFINGINLFVGDNAQGKTNIIESIYLSAFGKSYRTSKDQETIKLGESFCNVRTKYLKDDIENNIEICIGKNKNIEQNGIKVKKLSDHVGKLLIVIFSPESLEIVKGAPIKRRAFLDTIGSQLSKSYLISLQEYMKCIKLKNSILKKENIDRDYILILHEKMAEYIEKIVKFRKVLIEKLLNKARSIHLKLTDSSEILSLEYVSEFANMSKKDIIKLLNSFLNVEILKKVSIKGIQRDDINIYINELLVAKYGSQGQNRTALLSLKLADFEVLKEEKNQTPILLLDDIMSELDQKRIEFLLKYIKNYQCVLTTTDINFIKDTSNIKISKVFGSTLEI
ncbi:MAG: DNA replication/repair protein RecF [Clostridia bacterium]